MNVGNIKDCYGCGVCATVCSHNAISIIRNKNGFLEPSINNQICVECGLCIDVCAYTAEDVSLKSNNLTSYSGWSNDSLVQYNCSSGGVGFEIARYLMNKGYKFCGVKYNHEQQIAEHYISHNIDELKHSVGSKYIQSYTTKGFKQINKKDKYLVCGTPCQIDSLRRYIKKNKIENNFILMDFFCHGVPSYLLWDKYISEMRHAIGEIKEIKWRDKTTGWHDSWCMNICGTNKIIKSRLTQGDKFYRLFLNDSCLNPACYDKCKYKYQNSSADVRIGDAWGDYYKNNDKGVSSIVAFTSKGNKILHNVDIHLEKLDLDIIAEGQMKNSPIRPIEHELVMRCLKDPSVDLSQLISNINRMYIRRHRINQIKHPYNTLKKIIKRINEKK